MKYISIPVTPFEQNCSIAWCDETKESVFIDQTCVFGESEKYASALISPNFSMLEKQLQSLNISFNSKEELIQSSHAQEIFKEELKKINKSLNQVEQIVRFKLVPHEWSPDAGELSPTLKLKRKVIHAKYQSLIDEVYRK